MSDNSVHRVTAYTIRFFISPREYTKLVNKFGRNCTHILPSPDVVAASASQGDDHVQGIVRSQARLFVASYGLLGLLNAVILKRRGNALDASKVAISITGISGIYKVLYGLLTVILQRWSDLPNDESVDNTAFSPPSRATVSFSTPSPRSTTPVIVPSTSSSRPISPASSNKAIDRIDKLLIKKIKCVPQLIPPLLSGLVAGSAFVIFPEAAQGYIALYVGTRSLEFIYNYLDDSGYLEFKPRILGSWALFPFAFSQLFYTFIFYPDCCPPIFRKIMLRLSDGYMPSKPRGYPIDQSWPDADQVISSIAVISRARYPKFVTPILFPDPKTFTIPDGLDIVEPVISLAHPAMTTLTGALTHPTEPSEFRTYTELVLSKYSSLSKYLFAAYAALAVIRNTNKGKFAEFTLRSFAGILPNVIFSSVANTARTSTFVVMTAASAWYGIGLSQQVLNNKFVPVLRFRLIGFLAGLWAFADQVNGRARYMYTVRLAILSHWNTLLQQRKGRPLVKHGNTILFALSFAALMTVFDIAPKSIPGRRLREVLNWIKTNKYEDPTESQQVSAMETKDETKESHGPQSVSREVQN